MTFANELTKALVAFFTGCLVMFYALRAEQPVEKPAVEVRQADGSLTLAKDPGAARQADAMAPKPDLPPGKVTRTTVIKVKPKPQPKPEPKPEPPGDDGMCLVIAPQECPPVTVRLDLVETPDGTRVNASSPDGEIITGLDVPRVPITLRKEFKWSVGVVVTSDKEYGGYMDRDLGILRVGAEAVPGEARLRIGLRF